MMRRSVALFVVGIIGCGGDDAVIERSRRGASGASGASGGSGRAGASGKAGASGASIGGAAGTVSFAGAAGTSAGGTTNGGASGDTSSAGSAGTGANAGTGGTGGSGGAGGTGTGGKGGTGGSAGTGGAAGKGGGSAGSTSGGKGGKGGSGSTACVPVAEICDGLDNDCDGVADDDLAGCDPCAPRHELPVVTHWSNSTKTQSFLASDQASFNQSYPTGGYVPGACAPVFSGGYYPDYEDYLGDDWSTTAIPDAEVKTTLTTVCARAGVPVRLLRPDAVGTSRVVDRPGAVQIVSNVIIDGALATFILPPNWSASAPPGTYPIVFNSYYETNDTTFHGDGPEMMRLVAMSGTAGRSGAIAIITNGSGTNSSRGLNPGSIDQAAAIFEYAATHFSADKQRVLAFGISRGGGTALMVASNPKHLDYRVTFAAVAVPPVRIGELTALQSTTYPGLIDAVAGGTGHWDAWRLGWTYPACANKPHLTGKTGPEAHLYVMTGETDPDVADATVSLISPPYIAGLKAAGTQVYMESGSHDFIVAYAHQVEYGRALIAAGVPLEVKLMIRAGHHRMATTGAKTFDAVYLERTWQALERYVDPAKAGQPTVNPGVALFAVDRVSKTLKPISPPDDLHPFVLEGPSVAVPGHRFPLVMVGGPGTQWEVTLTHAQGPISWTGTIPASWKSIQWVDVGAGVPRGPYKYGLRIKKPGAAGWQEIPATASIDGSVAHVTVVDGEPLNVSANQAAIAAAPPTLAPFNATTWGLSEY